jgi:hypothetical protein
MKSPDHAGGFFVLGFLLNKNIPTSKYNSGMDQFTYVLIAFTVLLCLAVLVIILLNQRVRRLQRGKTKPDRKTNLRRNFGREKAANRNAPGWQQVEPIEVAKKVYESGITNLN